MLKTPVFCTLFLCVFFLHTSRAQTYTDVNSKVISQFANDMLFDSVRTQNLIVSIPSKDVFKGNSIGFIDPQSGTVSAHYPAGSEPGCIALSPNATFLYFGLNAASSFKRFNMETRTLDQTVSTGTTFSGALYAGDISCSPSSDTVIAVSIQDRYENAYCVNIYQNGIKLRDSVGWPTRMNVVQYYTPSVIYGYNNQSSGFNLYTMITDNNGVRLVNDIGNLFDGFQIDFSIQGNTAVSDNGRALDISVSPPAALGTYQWFNSGPTLGSIRGCYDRHQDLWCFAGKGFGDDIVYIHRFYAGTFLRKDIIRIGRINSDVTRIVCWGDSTRLAISTEQGQMIIVNGEKEDRPTGVSHINADHSQSSMHPNPASDMISFNYPDRLNISICNMLGEQVLQAQDVNQLWIGSLPEAVYTVSISDSRGNLLGIQKLIKH
jgi:hypothetical protein